MCYVIPGVASLTCLVILCFSLLLTPANEIQIVLHWSTELELRHSAVSKKETSCFIQLFLVITAHCTLVRLWGHHLKIPNQHCEIPPGYRSHRTVQGTQMSFTAKKLQVRDPCSWTARVSSTEMTRNARKCSQREPQRWLSQSHKRTKSVKQRTNWS